MAPNMPKDVQHREEEEEVFDSITPEATPRRYTIVYPMVLVFAYLHIRGLHGLYLAITSAKMGTILFNFVFYLIGGCGITAGAHRLWSHRAYKAKLPLQILLILMFSILLQSSIMYWARDHRLHHKYCDTDADPHNSKRGLFYSHIGCLIVKRHPDVIKSGKTMDFTDLYNNPVLEFQRKYYSTISALLVFILSTLIPMYFWQETFNASYHMNLLRYLLHWDQYHFCHQQRSACVWQQTLRQTHIARTEYITVHDCIRRRLPQLSPRTFSSSRTITTIPDHNYESSNSREDGKDFL